MEEVCPLTDMPRLPRGLPVEPREAVIGHLGTDQRDMLVAQSNTELPEKVNMKKS